ncbi:MAG: hypothetical protein GF353_13530 [Candidatus Lokiarchaeota archaeon]|nr:hypothetical protein [Candidatus Lokiarchaeota archaeon]
MQKIEIHCPICSKRGHIEIADDSMKNLTRGLLAINVLEDMVCEHSFVAYVDKNLKVRDYFTADFQLQVSEIVDQDNIQEQVPKTELIDLDLIKMNFPSVLLSYVIKSIFIKNKVLLLSDKSFLNKHIVNFFNYITKATFEYEISLLSRENYHANKKEYEDYAVFEGNKILNNPNNAINSKKLKIESSIVEKFFEESDLISSLIVLRNEIKKIYNLTKSIADFYKKGEKKKLSSKQITDFLQEEHNLKIQKDFKIYLDFLTEVVRTYFGVEVYKTSNVADFLEYI